jgi:dihydropteroate synthase
MQKNPSYEDVVDEVKAFLASRVEAAVAAGVDERRIWVDPGIGFGKTVEHNLALLRGLGKLRDLGRPIVVGTSRKRFLGSLTGREVGDRLGGSLASNVLALAQGAEVFRVHEVLAARQALSTAEVILGRRGWRATPAAA